MRSRSFAVIVAFVATLAPVALAHAQAPYGPAYPPPQAHPAGPVTVFRTGIRGLGLGAWTGLAAAYLIARDDGWDKNDDWRTLGYGALVGGIVGAGTGLVLGITDVARGGEPRGSAYIEAMAAGSIFGTAVGALGGTVAYLNTKDGEHVLLGAAIGTLAGVALGAVVAMVDTNRRAPGQYAEAPRNRFALTLAPMRDAAGATYAMPALAGRF